MFLSFADMSGVTFKDAYLGAFCKMLNKRHKDVDAVIKQWPSDYKQKIADSFAETNRHILLVRDVMSNLDTVTSFDPDNHRTCYHDWSKTPYYMFVVAGVKEFGITDPDLQTEYARLVHHHYKEEDHHPEWEKLNRKECSDRALREMAVDRLAMALQKNNGVFIRNNFEKFLPKFTYNHEEKLVRYLKYVDDLFDAVMDGYEKHFIVSLLPDVEIPAEVPDKNSATNTLLPDSAPDTEISSANTHNSETPDDSVTQSESSQSDTQNKSSDGDSGNSHSDTETVDDQSENAPDSSTGHDESDQEGDTQIIDDQSENVPDSSIAHDESDEDASDDTLINSSKEGSSASLTDDDCQRSSTGCTITENGFSKEIKGAFIDLFNMCLNQIPDRFDKAFNPDLGKILHPSYKVLRETYRQICYRSAMRRKNKLYNISINIDLTGEGNNCVHMDMEPDD